MTSLLSVRIVLDPAAVNALQRTVTGSGGFQSLLRQLQNSLADDGSLTLTPAVLGRIAKYVSSYGEGGFQGRLGVVLTELKSLAKALEPMAA